MEHLEAIKSISTLTWKSIDEMSDKEKKEAINNLLEDMDNLWASKRLNKIWSPLSEEQKLNIYNDWDITGIHAPLKDLNLSPQYIIKQFTSLKENWVKSSFKYTLLKTIAPACRFCIELWILDKPDWLSEKELIKDVKKDARHIKNSLAALDLACYAVPELKPIQPYIKMIKPYVKRYKKHWTDVLISRLNKKKWSYAVIEDKKENLVDALNNRDVSENAA